MAVDEWLFQKAWQNPGRLYLRLYTWSEGAITFGFNQKLSKAVMHDKLGATVLIRRITGGRALYHDPSELTYAIAFNSEGKKLEKLTGSLSASSQTIAATLVDFLEKSGISAQFVRQSSGHSPTSNYFHTAPCFDSTARHEIISNSGKIVASAQRRIGNSFLQHGAIKINGVAVHPALGNTGQLKDNALPPVSLEQFLVYAELFQKSFEFSLELECERSHLTPDEKTMIEKLSEKIRKKAVDRREIIKQTVCN